MCTYPRHRAKRQPPFLFDQFQVDVPFNLLLGTRSMRTAAGSVYFHRNGVVDLAQGGTTTPSSERITDAGEVVPRRQGRRHGVASMSHRQKEL